MDLEWCRKQLALNQSNIYSTKNPIDKPNSSTAESAQLEPTYLIYTEPELHLCLSMPYFCSDTSWNYRTFRRLCQDTLPDGSVGSPYDCSLVDRWNEYEDWCNQLCCSEDPEFFGLESCQDERCSDDPSIQKILSSKFLDTFVLQHGFTPPKEKPLGNFLMDIDVQEARSHEKPLHLFDEWKDSLNRGHGPETLKPHNLNDPASSKPFMKISGCCSCRRHSLPTYFERDLLDSGFPDNKHQEVQFTITALDDIEITVVVELLHGLYYPDFDEYFGDHDKGDLVVHTPKVDLRMVLS